MRNKALTVAGISGVLLSTILTVPAAASAAPAPAAPATAASKDFIAMLAPVAPNKVTGSGEAWLTLNGNSAKFIVQVSGLLAGSAHAAQIYVTAEAKCPGSDSETGAIPLADAASTLGTPEAALTTIGKTAGMSWLDLSKFPTQADYTYARTFAVDPAVVTAVNKGTAVLVVHGIDYNANGKYDGVLGTTPGNATVPAEASAPALCGAFVPSQVQSMPSGAAQTGGGSASAHSDPAALWFGVTALLAGLAAAFVAFRRRGTAATQW